MRRCGKPKTTCGLRSRRAKTPSTRRIAALSVPPRPPWFGEDFERMKNEMQLNLEKHKYAAQYGGQILGHYTNPECAANSVRDAHNRALGTAVPGFCGVAHGAAIVLTLSECLATAGRKQ